MPLLDVILAAALLAATPGAAPSGERGYVGSATCGGCHTEQMRDWQGSNHQRAMQVADPATVLGNFKDAPFTDRAGAWRFLRSDQGYVARATGPSGTPDAFAVLYTFGVEPLQQYLVGLPGGRLQALTVAWDARPASAGGQRWFDLYPDERLLPGDPLHWSGSDQNWNYQCAFCHSTDLRARFDLATDSYATTWSEISVGCEACHGPGAAHVAWAKRPADAPAEPSPNRGLAVSLERRAAGTFAIDAATGTARPVPPAAAQAEIETCAPCHARRSEIAESYTPGEPFLDAFLPALLTPGHYHADGQIDGEVYEWGSFLQSRMFHAGIACSDCHNPHSGRLRAAGDAICAQCHLPGKYAAPTHHRHPVGSAGASCIGCHMPTRTYMVVDPRHDHSLRVPRPDWSVSLGTPNACNDCHKDRDASWAAATVREWLGRDARGFQTYAPALHAARRDAPAAPKLLVDLLRDSAQPAIARATAVAALEPAVGLASSAPGMGSVGPPVLPAVESALRDASPLVRAAAVSTLESVPEAQRLALAAPLLDDPRRIVRIEAARVLASVSMQTIDPAMRTRLTRGLAEYITAQKAAAERPEAHTNIATALASRGELAVATEAFQTALRLRPDFTPARLGLADVYRVQRRDSDGEALLREGLVATPSDAALHHSLGLLLARQQRLDEATAELRRAAELEPDAARFVWVLAIALNSQGQTDAALKTLAAARATHPFDRRILTALVTINRDAGRRDEARRYAAELKAMYPDDPGIAALVAQLQ